MRITQVRSQGWHFLQFRKKLESVSFQDSEESVHTIQQAFPNHLVFHLGSTIEVANMDATIKVACFQEQPTEQTEIPA